MTKEELGTLILASERQFYATAKTILYSDHDCADAIQETIVKAFVKLPTLKKDAYAKTWLIRILLNECYNILRKENRQELLKDRRKNCLKQTEETTDKKEQTQSSMEADAGNALLQTTIEINIVRGDDSGTVARKLQNAGMVESATEYDAYLMQHGYDKKIRVGKVEIPVDATWQEIAEYISGKR